MFDHLPDVHLDVQVLLLRILMNHQNQADPENLPKGRHWCTRGSWSCSPRHFRGPFSWPVLLVSLTMSNEYHNISKFL